jgi:hypothetical protein
MIFTFYLRIVNTFICRDLKKIYFLYKTGLFTEEKGFFTKKKIPGLPSTVRRSICRTSNNVGNNPDVG